ncbi:MAG: hypothetical protein ABI721_01265 [Candidatus Dojkabacteria bacterium]
MPEFLKRKRNLAIIAIILLVLCFLCISIAVIFYISTRPAPDNNVVNPPVAVTPPPISIPEIKPIVAKKPLGLKFPANFDLLPYEDEGCDRQLGMEIYGIKNNPEAIRSQTLVINRQILPANDSEIADYNNAISLMDEIFSYNESSYPAGYSFPSVPFLAFYYYCGGAAFTKLDSFNVDYPGTEKAIVIPTIGGYQANFPAITELDMTLYIYAEKNGDILEAMQRFKAPDVFSEAEAQACMVIDPDPNGYNYIDPECLANNARGDLTKKAIYQQKAETLMNLFELVE